MSTPTITPEVTDTFRRDLIARLYVAMVSGGMRDWRLGDLIHASKKAIEAADTLIERLEATP